MLWTLQSNFPDMSMMAMMSASSMSFLISNETNDHSGSRNCNINCTGDRFTSLGQRFDDLEIFSGDSYRDEHDFDAGNGSS